MTGDNCGQADLSDWVNREWRICKLLLGWQNRHNHQGL